MTRGWPANARIRTTGPYSPAHGGAASSADPPRPSAALQLLHADSRDQLTDNIAPGETLQISELFRDTHTLKRDGLVFMLKPARRNRGHRCP